MSKELSQVEFYFPKGIFESKDNLANSIISLMEEKESINYSGFSDVDLLKTSLIEHIGNGDLKKYRGISEDQKKEIEKTITETVGKCNKGLSIPTKNFIFIYPFLTTEDDKVFDGVIAVAVYSCVFHVFVDLDAFSKKSIENTVAHELNHTIYYYHHYDDFNNYTLLDEILLEGLAENFREQFFDPEVTPWAGALERVEALDLLKKSIGILNSRDKTAIKDFLFGNSEYKKWTGYSVGYWLVKEFIEKNNNLSWDEIIKTDPSDFIDIIK